MSERLAALIPAAGSRARLHTADGVEVVISASLLRGHLIQHLAVWVHAGIRYEQWVDDHEVILADNCRSVEIGYRR